MNTAPEIHRSGLGIIAGVAIAASLVVGVVYSGRDSEPDPLTEAAAPPEILAIRRANVDASGISPVASECRTHRHAQIDDVVRTRLAELSPYLIRPALQQLETEIAIRGRLAHLAPYLITPAMQHLSRELAATDCGTA